MWELMPRDDNNALEEYPLQNLSVKAQLGIGAGIFVIPLALGVNVLFAVSALMMLLELVAALLLVAGCVVLYKNERLRGKIVDSFAVQFVRFSFGFPLAGVGEQREDVAQERIVEAGCAGAREPVILPSAFPREVVVPESRIVDLGDDLRMDIDDLVGKSILICGIRRSGKTTLGALIAEEMGRFLIPMLIPDIKRDYLSLVDVLPRALVVGSREVNEENARRMGHAIFQEGYQLILDMVSYNSVDSACVVLVGMIEGLFEWALSHPRDKRPCGVFLDEAQSFLPQNGGSIITEKEVQQDMLSAYGRVVAVGGSLGPFPVILTQRIGQTNKIVCAQPELLFLLKQTMDNDLIRYANFTTVDREVIRGFKKGQGVFVDYEGNSSIIQFHNRQSDGLMSASPRASAALRPLSSSLARENYPYVSEVVLEEKEKEKETRVLDLGDFEEGEDGDVYRKSLAKVAAPIVPIVPDKGIRTDDVPDNTLVIIWNGLEKKTVDGLQEAFNCTRHQAHKAYQRIQTLFTACTEEEI